MKIDNVLLRRVAAAKLSAEMADRLRGDTAEELAADAKKLAETLGFDRAPVDPSQGKGADGQALKPASLGASIRAHYNIT